MITPPSSPSRTSVVPNPQTFEAAMSLLTLAIASLGRHPPVTREDMSRVNLAASKLETVARKAARRLETVE